MPAEGDSFAVKVTEIWNEAGEKVDSAPHPQEILRVRFERPVKKFDMLRKETPLEESQGQYKEKGRSYGTDTMYQLSADDFAAYGFSISEYKACAL